MESAAQMMNTPINTNCDTTPEMREHPVFNAIWDVIKTWDVNVPADYTGYCGAHGGHARVIFEAVQAVEVPSARDGIYTIDVNMIGWQEIRAFEAALAHGQSVYEDAGGFMVRALRSLLGIKPDPDARVHTYRAAAMALLEKCVKDQAEMIRRGPARPPNSLR